MHNVLTFQSIVLLIKCVRIIIISRTEAQLNVLDNCKQRMNKKFSSILYTEKSYHKSSFEDKLLYNCLYCMSVFNERMYLGRVEYYIVILNKCVYLDKYFLVIRSNVLCINRISNLNYLVL